eukprot:21122-Heterococcus_DN1.PRE.3
MKIALFGGHLIVRLRSLHIQLSCSTASRHSAVPLVWRNTCGAYTHVLYLQQAQHKITLINCTTECVAFERPVLCCRAQQH